MEEQIVRKQKFEKALLIGIYLKSTDLDSCANSLEELDRLTQTYGMEAVDRVPCMVRKISPATLLGKGKLQECVALALEFDVDVVIFDDEISPNQQKNLEKEFKLPVIDRTELILEVFAQRAQTKEARLQVELAKVRYQMPRLKRLWSHLSRQVASGSGYLKGEGEKQLELDKRMLRRQIVELEKEIEEVRAHRHVERAARLRSHIPTFAIVGYTNAGKSTLMRALTAANILVEDKLFATLDTTTRRFILPNNQPILLVDTVGFIQKIPHTLIAAFKSTLEEAVHTDVLIHLIDASSPQALLQAEATLEVLKELGIKDQPIITVLNKIDRCEGMQMVQKLKISYPQTILLSALEGKGVPDLLERLMKTLESLRKRLWLKIPQSEYALVSEVRRIGHVLHLEYEDDDVVLHVEIPRELEHKFRPFITEKEESLDETTFS